MSEEQRRKEKLHKRQELEKQLTPESKKAVDWQRRANKTSRLISQGKLPRSAYPPAPRLF